MQVTRGAVVLLWGFAVLMATGRARADEEQLLASIDVAWTAPQGCPNSHDVRRQIRALLAEIPAAVHGPGFRATVTKNDERWILRAETGAVGASHAKVIEADSCAALSEAFALIVAFAIDPSARPAEPRAPEPLAAAVSAASAEGPAPDVPPAPHPSQAWSVSLGPLGATAMGVLPAPAFGWGAKIAVGRGLRWELAGLFWPERTSMLSGEFANLGVQASLWTIEPSVCIPIAGPHAAACFGAQLGAMRAVGVVASPTQRSSWWLAFSAGAAGDLTLSRAVGIRLRLDIGVPLLRPSFALERVGPSDPVEVWRPAPLFVIVSLEPELRFSSTGLPPPGH